MGYEPKPLFVERIEKLLPDEADRESYWKIIRTKPQNSIRCNTIKISPEKLKERLESKGWKIEQPYQNFPEIMIIKNELLPGETGKSIEHLLGYYYVQEISSMLPILTLNPQQGDLFLDLCASPGSKTTQASASMNNQGTIIANDKDIERISILSANLERCGCSNAIITRHDGIELCKRLNNLNIKFDKILCDVPCSGEGTLRSSPKTHLIWNINMIKKLSNLQKKLAESAFSLLKESGEMIYSTCTHAPEENEEIINFLVEKFNCKVEKVELPIKTREGLTSWQGQVFNSQIKNCARIWPQDNDTEGFFVAKIKKGGK